ncbi:MAG: Slp family lipoprotein [Nitrospirota bacterium]|nr:Slp family lipoprotein [Nitrospirota bacterium]
MKKFILFCLFLTMLSSCAHVISPENRENALSTIPLSEVRAHADQYTEKTFIFGGLIADTFNSKDGSEIEIVQMPLDEWGYVIRRDRSDGRFIVTAQNHLDPLIFSKGREVTISGVLVGIRTEKLGKKDYDYPLFRAKEIHLLRHRPYYSDTYYGYEPLYYPYPFYGYGQPYYPYPYYWYNPFMYGPSFYFHYSR